MLLGQARLTAGGRDCLKTKISAGNAGQSQARSKYLPASLTHAAIYENSFHIIFPATENHEAIANRQSQTCGERSRTIENDKIRLLRGTIEKVLDTLVQIGCWKAET